MRLKIIIATIICVCLIVLIVFLARPEPIPLGPKAEFALQAHQTKDLKDPLIKAGCQRFFCEWSARAKGLPEKDASRAKFYQMEFAGRPTTMALIESKKPKLYVDTDGDGDLSNEQVIDGTRKRSGFWIFASNEYRFGPVDLKIKSTDRTAQLMFHFEDAFYLKAYPAAYRTGQIQVGDDTYRVAVMDGNFDGEFTSGWTSKREWERERAYDYLAIDFDKDGEFYHDHTDYVKTEIRPLTDMVRIGDAYYDIKFNDDYSAIQLRKAEVQMGTLDVGCPDAELVLFSAFGLENVKQAGGKWDLPAGHYTCWSANLIRTDENKDRWRLQGSGESGKLKNFKIKAGKTLSLKMGPPLKIKVDQRRGFSFFGKSISMGLDIVGQAGETYGAGAMKNHWQQPTPTLKIIGKDGKTLAQGQFEYG